MLTLVAALALAPNWSQRLPDGTTIQLVSVSNFGAKKSWSPDGKAQKTWVAPDTIKQLYNGKTTKQLSLITNFVFQFTPRDLSAMPSVAFKMGEKNLGLSYTLRDQHNASLWWTGAGTDNRKLPKTVDIKVGIGSGKWTALAKHNLQSGEGNGPKFFGYILRDVKYPGNPNPIVVLDGTIPKGVAGKMAYQIKLFDSTGQALKPAGIGPTKAGVPARWFFVDSGNRLLHADLLTQPYKWLTFKGVRTKVGK